MAGELTGNGKVQVEFMALGVLMAPGDRTPPGSEGKHTSTQHWGMSPLPRPLPAPLIPWGTEAMCLCLRTKEILTG